jgi:hypothetical protein
MLESTLSVAGRNNIFEYLLLKMPVGRRQNTKFLGIKLKNLGFQEGAGTTYLSIFYLK